MLSKLDVLCLSSKLHNHSYIYSMYTSTFALINRMLTKAKPQFEYTSTRKLKQFHNVLKQYDSRLQCSYSYVCPTYRNPVTHRNSHVCLFRFALQSLCYSKSGCCHFDKIVFAIIFIAVIDSLWKYILLLNGCVSSLILSVESANL